MEKNLSFRYENLEILFFSKRWNQKSPLQLPIDAAFRLVG
jgi:hypothetical protein